MGYLMSKLISIQTRHGVIIGSWEDRGLSIDFVGGLFHEEVQIGRNFKFSVPSSFIAKHGKLQITREIESTINDYLEIAEVAKLLSF